MNHICRFSVEETSRLNRLLDTARDLAGCYGWICFRPAKSESDTLAVTSWSLFMEPSIWLMLDALDQDDDDLGVSLTHELIHVRQGAWRVFWGNFIWFITGYAGFPPHEVEAYDAVNLWYDHKEGNS